MSFMNFVHQYQNFDFENYFSSVTENDILNCLSKDKLNAMDFLALLSPKAGAFLEPMAQKAQKLTFQYFGRVVHLYIPLYLSNFCLNECAYCGFKKNNQIQRKKLSLEEIEKEAEVIAKTQMKHILILTGENRQVTPPEYINQAVKILRKYFSSVSIEIYPMETDEYIELKKTGVDGLTVYQEVYDPEIYDQVHISGYKKNYQYRLDAPERGAKAGLRMVNIGTLFGLGDKYREAFLSGLHAAYLEDRYLDTEISLSLPRLNEAEGGYQAPFPVDDPTFVQFILAYRIFLPKVGITISTRESSDMRDNLLGLGLTRMSAGSKTEVGGFLEHENSGTSQFVITDGRSPDEIIKKIRSKGFQPVFKDWEMS